MEAVAALEPVAVQGLAGPVALAGAERGAEGAQLSPASLCQTQAWVYRIVEGCTKC